MVQINFGQREVSCKIVFYGPGMSGKTTNLEIIHQKAPKQAVGEMVSIATETDRTLYFDFMPMDLGQVAGMHTKFMLYTVPGQIYYNATRKLVLQGVDGVIFVADSDPNKMGENIESLQNLRDNLAEMGLTIDDMPLVLQYNKRDLPNALPVADMNARMNPTNAPAFEACARDGKGVFATLKEVSRLVIEKLNKEHAPASNRRRTASSMTPVKASPTSAPAAPAQPPVAQRASPGAVRPAAGNQPSGANPVSGARPMQRPAAPGVPPPVAAAPARRPIPAAAATTAMTATPPAANEELSAREKHLAKAKPPSLGERKNAPVDLGTTDPHLKRYQMAQQKGLLSRVLTLSILCAIAAALVLSVLVVFVKPVREAIRPMLPGGMQKMLMDDPPPTAPVAPATAAPAAPAAPTAPAAVPPTAAAPAPAGAVPAAGGK